MVFLQRFQKTYEAEEVESELEKKQLAMLHQQRVQAELNDKKRRTLDNYMQTIDDYDTDVSPAEKRVFSLFTRNASILLPFSDKLC